MHLGFRPQTAAVLLCAAFLMVSAGTQDLQLLGPVGKQERTPALVKSSHPGLPVNRESAQGPLRLHMLLGAQFTTSVSRGSTEKKENEAEFAWPLNRNKQWELTSLYGYRLNPTTHQGYQFHHGIDIKADLGEPVYAAADGILLLIPGRSKPEYAVFGNLAIIRHADGKYSWYAHLSRFGRFATNQAVKKGDLIGYVGQTGASTGPHLHFGLANTMLTKYNDVATSPAGTLGFYDPLPFLNVNSFNFRVIAKNRAEFKHYSDYSQKYPPTTQALSREALVKFTQ